jgi:CelD/BcsL family acetyltransferase involved in cellulose biosynthesis
MALDVGSSTCRQGCNPSGCEEWVNCSRRRVLWAIPYRGRAHGRHSEADPHPFPLSVEVIDREGALAPVLDEWRRLAAARGNAFLTPEWYLAALNILHRGAVPAVAVLRGGDGAVRGLFPFVDVRSSRRRRLISFPGTRFGDIFHPVAEQRDEVEVAAAVAPVLARHVGARCRFDLGRVGFGAGWWRELARAWPGRMTVVAQPEEVLPYIALDGFDWQGYLATRSGQFRSQLKRKMRSLERDHEVRLRRSETAEEVSNDLDTLFDLHDARWEERPGASSFANLEARDLHRAFAVAAHEHGWLRLYLLEVDGAAAAAWYGWHVGDRFSYYQAGFEPTWSRYSVGFLLLAETVREGIAEGAGEYDLLVGDEAFKGRFATGERLGSSVLLAPPISGTRLTASAKRVARSGVRAMPGPARDRIRAVRQKIRSSRGD